MTAAPDRIGDCFRRLKAAGRGGLVTFITAGDPDRDTSLALLRGLPGAGADIVELGMPFSDPMADGPVIEAASRRALAAAMTVKGVLSLAGEFRSGDAVTPLVLMGYFNPIHAYGVAAFMADAAAAGVDGLIVVDVPLEESDCLSGPARANGIILIRLVPPTADDARIKAMTDGAQGFVYAVSMAGTTGAASVEGDAVARLVARIRATTTLPIAVGFGIKSPDHVAAVNRNADAAVVGSALVARMAAHIDQGGGAAPGLVQDALDFVAALAKGDNRSDVSR